LVFTDNQSALALSRSTIVTKKSKHIALRYHVVRDHVKNLCYCPTDVNKADPLTKGLPGAKYMRLFKSNPSEEVVDVVQCHFVSFQSSVKEMEIY
jgi:hypothetical protein